MKLWDRIRFVGSVVSGAFIVHYALVACSAGAGNMGGRAGSIPAARADGDAPGSVASCTHWEVKAFNPAHVSFVDVGGVDSSGRATTYRLPDLAVTIDDGWEPFTTTMGGYGVVGRRCAK